MGDWESICGILSDIFESNRPHNFDIHLTPEQVATYLSEKILFARLNSTDPSELKAALFVTTDGECGFIASHMSLSIYKYFVNEFKNLVIVLPEELRTKLWCRIQKDNHIVQSLALRMGFSLAQETGSAFYYTYKGG